MYGWLILFIYFVFLCRKDALILLEMYIINIVTFEFLESKDNYIFSIFQFLNLKKKVLFIKRIMNLNNFSINIRKNSKRRHNLISCTIENKKVYK